MVSVEYERGMGFVIIQLLSHICHVVYLKQRWSDVKF